MFATLTAAQEDQSSQQRIALVAPEPSSTLIAALTNAGYDVKSYAHPLRVLEDIVDNPIKMAIVAPDLPWMSGAALARTLRDSYNVTEVILMAEGMKDEAVMARVRTGAPIERAAVAKVKPARPRRSTATTSRTGRRIIVRTARST